MEKPSHLAVVLGMYETGLAVARSLGRAGIRVRGLDHSLNLGFRSRYVEASLCPKPLAETEAFVDCVVQLAEGENQKPVLFVTSDDFLLAVSRNRERLQQFFLLNLPVADTLESIADKFRQYELACTAGIPAPETFAVQDQGDLAQVRERLLFPVFIKAREVTSWRRTVGVARKGFVAHTPEQLAAHFQELFALGAAGIVQQLIPGPDTNHYKACCYISQDGNLLLAFALRKLRQQPPGFGFGCLVESTHEPDVLALGKRFLESIGYRGVGSVEFKRDERDGKFKVIELNPRYWQQNGLADRCGMNFPLVHYREMTGADPVASDSYQEGIKWVSLVHDWESFRTYRQRGELTFGGWLRSLRGPKVYSDFARDDPWPGFYAVRTAVTARIRARTLGRAARQTSGDTNNES